MKGEGSFNASLVEGDNGFSSLSGVFKRPICIAKKEFIFQISSKLSTCLQHTVTFENQYISIRINTTFEHIAITVRKNNGIKRKFYDKKHQIDIAILDFAKAFDTVPHDKLL